MMYHHQNQNENGSLERMRINGDIGSNSPNSIRLLGSPRGNHMPDNYEDLPLDFNHIIFTSLEKYLPSHVINLSRDLKAHYMSNILLRYLPHSERIRVSYYHNINLPFFSFSLFFTFSLFCCFMFDSTDSKAQGIQAKDHVKLSCKFSVECQISFLHL